METDRKDNDDESMTEDTASDRNGKDLEGENNDYIKEETEGAPEDRNEEIDPWSMNEGPGDVSFDFEYHQNEVIEKLSCLSVI